MRPWLYSLLIHLGLVTAACFVLVVMLWGPQPDANIGAGMLQFIVLAGLALPWSLLWFLGVLPDSVTPSICSCSSPSPYSTWFCMV